MFTTNNFLPIDNVTNIGNCMLNATNKQQALHLHKVTMNVCFAQYFHGCRRRYTSLKNKTKLFLKKPRFYLFMHQDIKHSYIMLLPETKETNHPLRIAEHISNSL